jgi:hypothetical protein
MTDICWSCLFPISIGPVKVSGGGREDTENPHQIPCVCPRAPYFGIPVGFWEPARLVDVTRIPFCMVSMGGVKMGNSFINYGVHGANGDKGHKIAFIRFIGMSIPSFIGLNFWSIFSVLSSKVLMWLILQSLILCGMQMSFLLF